MAPEPQQHSEASVRDLASASLGVSITDLTRLEGGAWSESFGFHTADQHLVIRLAATDDDYERDAVATRYRTAQLPIPEVHAIGTTAGGYYAISTYAEGEPLEVVRPSERVTDATMHVLESLRTADISHTSGWGDWDDTGNAPASSWRDYLLAINDDVPGSRLHGWRDRVAAVRDLPATFEWGYDLLERVAVDDVPRSLVHADLLNRNVHVSDGRITGVFDWGSSMYGDHLYDLACFTFWATRLPTLDVDSLLAGLRRRWRHRGYSPANFERRMLICHLHIGLEHIAYHALRDNPAEATRVATQMRALAS